MPICQTASHGGTIELTKRLTFVLLTGIKQNFVDFFLDESDGLKTLQSQNASGLRASQSVQAWSLSLHTYNPIFPGLPGYILTTVSL